jgi:phosphoserine aminotransferase
MARTNLDVPSNSEAVHIAGNETITGTKTFSNNDTYF